MNQPPERPVLAVISPNHLSQQLRQLHRRDSMEGFIPEDDPTQNSLPKSDDSNISNLSLLSDEFPSDDLDRRMLQHARHGQTRWTKRAALDSEPLTMHQPFRKSKPGLGLVSMMREVDDNPVPTPPTHNHPLSPNLPRQWGRRGKQRNDFLRRLNASPSEQAQPSPYDTYDEPVQDNQPEITQQNPLVVAESQMTAKRASLLSHDFGTKKSRSTNDLQNKSHETAAENGSSHDSDRFVESAQPLPQLMPNTAKAESARQRDARNTAVQRPKFGVGAAGATKYGSRDLLQQLSRAASSSPNPIREDAASGRNTVPKSTERTGQDQERHTRTESTGESLWRGIRRDRSREGEDGIAAEVDGGGGVGLEQANSQNLSEELSPNRPAELEAGDLSTLLDIDDDTLDLVSNVAAPSRKGQGLRLEEKEALRRMTVALKSVRTGIRDASLGIKRVRHQFAQADDTRSQDLSHKEKACPHCGSASRVTVGHVISGTWHACRARLYSRPQTGGLIKLTWLGILILAVLLWSVTEITLCEYYCHPLYAEYMIGYGVDIRKPRMPYVTTTIMIKRPLEWIGGPGADLIKRYLVDLVPMLTGGRGFAGGDVQMAPRPPQPENYYYRAEQQPLRWPN